jgi:hypothetical protein
MSGRSFGVAGLYHFNPEGNYSPFVKLGWNHHSFRVTAPTRDSEGGSGNNEFYFNCVFILLPYYYYYYYL